MTMRAARAGAGAWHRRFAMHWSVAADGRDPAK